MIDLRDAQALPEDYVRRVLGILIEDAGGRLHIEERRIVEAYNRTPRVPHIVGFRTDQPGSGVTLEIVNHDTITGATP